MLSLLRKSIAVCISCSFSVNLLQYCHTAAQSVPPILLPLLLLHYTFFTLQSATLSCVPPPENHTRTVCSVNRSFTAPCHTPMPEMLHFTVHSANRSFTGPRSVLPPKFYTSTVCSASEILHPHGLLFFQNFTLPQYTLSLRPELRFPLQRLHHIRSASSHLPAFQASQ